MADGEDKKGLQKSYSFDNVSFVDHTTQVSAADIGAVQKAILRSLTKSSPMILRLSPRTSSPTL